MAADELVIQSHKGPYRARFVEDTADAVAMEDAAICHFIVDERVARLHRAALDAVLAAPSVLLLAATEDAKTLDRFPSYVTHLVERGLRRDHCLVAIGGGIVQDATCFLAATMLRGVEWRFVPTTLLAQADSCIGSKSSINAGAAKNILGTFTPPREAVICTRFLDTLDEADLRSGIGEILKVHAIEGPDAFARLAADYERLLTDRALLVRCIRHALEVKKRYIEIDEFDRGPRNVFNYGHSFGHAIEAATGFAVPHGIAVTIGMDMANFVAMRCDGADRAFRHMHPTLRANYRGFERQPVPLDRFLAAIAKDKKNVGRDLTLVLPGADGTVARVRRADDDRFRAACAEFLQNGRLA